MTKERKIPVPDTSVPLPPGDAEMLTTACDYCAVACGYRVYRWPVGRQGGPRAAENALGLDFPLRNDDPARPMPWVSPAQHNVVTYRGRAHHVIVIADWEARAVNLRGNHSMRGGTLAQKCYNPQTATRERLTQPMIRVNGKLTPVSWDLALDAMAHISKHVLAEHGEHAWAVKAYSYQYFENTYAITKLALTGIGTPAFAPHDKCANTNDATGLDDAGIDSFSASFEDWGACDVLLMSGVDPFVTKTTLFTGWIMRGANPHKKLIFVTPHKTMGVAWGLKQGGLWLPIVPGTDTILHNALARIIIENGWQDQEFIDRWIASTWEVDSGYGRGTRNTGWQWRTTWGAWQSDWPDYRKFILAQDEHKLENAARITGLRAEDIYRCAELIARPRSDGSRPKSSFMLEKGNYWSNNYMNSASFAALGLICGAGNRPGRVISRGGGHQRGMVNAGGASGWLSPEKYPGRRKKALNLDRWLMDGKLRFAWVFGTTWVSAMAGSAALRGAIERLTRENPHQITSLDRGALFETLSQRVDSGGMVLVDSDIYPVEPLGTQFADILLPAATWGEEDFSRCNSERRLRLYSKFYDAPGEAKPDWWAVQAFARKMGYGAHYGWKTGSDVFEEAARFSRGTVLDYAGLVAEAKKRGVPGHELLRSLGTTGIQTPIRVSDGQLAGTKRLHDPENQWGPTESTDLRRPFLYAFNTHSGKALLLKSPWRFPGWIEFYQAIRPRPEKGEIWVTNGRVDETWQSGFDDCRKPFTAGRGPHPLIFVNPADAAPQGIESGDRVLVRNDAVYVQTGMPQGVLETDLGFDSLLRNGHIRVTQAEFEAIAIVTADIREGVAKANFNFPGAAANSVVHAVPDPLTNNYRYKLGRGVLIRLGESPHKRSFSVLTLKPRAVI
ncbi:MAG: arsenate reductase (azurin) large subunit [Betaproteobacteria bacterium]|nr:arsenate reductase (azurin) large subunit [Betaproteobacteria bacterium]